RSPHSSRHLLQLLSRVLPPPPYFASVRPHLAKRRSLASAAPLVRATPSRPGSPPHRPSPAQPPDARPWRSLQPVASWRPPMRLLRRLFLPGASLQARVLSERPRMVAPLGACGWRHCLTLVME